ncbi:MAG: hypothetical protein IT569_00570 [Leptospiraceae bacterium]|nr:hypothetical protein [Leptospiraceae bacterium]
MANKTVFRIEVRTCKECGSAFRTWEHSAILLCPTCDTERHWTKLEGMSKFYNCILPTGERKTGNEY